MTLATQPSRARTKLRGASTATPPLVETLARAAQVADEEWARRCLELSSDLTSRQYVVLRTILANQGVTQTALVNVCRMDRSTLADVCRRLQKRGWVSRVRTKEDARAYAVRLTSEGLATLKIGETVAGKVDKHIASRLGPSLGRFNDLLATVGAAE